MTENNLNFWRVFDRRQENNCIELVDNYSNFRFYINQNNIEEKKQEIKEIFVTNEDIRNEALLEIENIKNKYFLTDPDAIRELELYIINTGELYTNYTTNIIKNHSKKYKKGVYNKELALKSWLALVEKGLKMYQKEFGTPGDKWYELLSVNDRKELAERLRIYYFENVNGNNPIERNI